MAGSGIAWLFLPAWSFLHVGTFLHSPPGPGEVVGVGDLAVCRVAGDDHHAATRGLDQRGVVGGGAVGQVSSAQHARSERLRRLHGHHLGTVGCVHHCAIGGHLLDRVGERDAGYRPVGPARYRVDDELEHVHVGERPGTVVHAHDRGLGGHLGEPGANRVATRGTARDAAFAVGVGGRHHHDHAVAGCSGSCHRPVEHPSIPESLVLLRPAETLAGAARDHDCPHRFQPI
jgi:hypothetical protein